MKFRKKPVVIEAIQWDGTYFGTQFIHSHFEELETISMDYHVEKNECSYWKIGTLEGGHIVTPGDYIIKGIVGEFYPCKNEIFQKTYEPVKDEV